MRCPETSTERLYRKLRSATVSLLLILSGATILSGGLQAEGSDLEARVKAAYVYNFTKFVDWPGDERASASEPIRICIIGNDPIRTLLGELSNREAKGRPIKVLRVKDINSLPPCNILYVCRSEQPQLATILERLQGMHLLTVSDIPSFAQKGGVIGFITENDRIKLEINSRAARQYGLKISAKLLEVAKVLP